MSSRCKHVTEFRPTAGVRSRPRANWKPRRPRGPMRSPLAGQMNQQVAPLIKQMFASFQQIRKMQQKVQKRG